MKKIGLTISLFLSCTAIIASFPITTQAIKMDKFIDQAKNPAKENDLYASVMIAQGIHESAIKEGEDGELSYSDLGSPPYHNLFGIKGDYEGQSVNMLTWEDYGNGQVHIHADFRKYPSHKESFYDYAALIKSQKGKNRKVASGELKGNDTEIYSCAWKKYAKTHEEAVRCLTGTYATDPEYTDRILETIKTYDLTKYDDGSSSSSSDSDTDGKSDKEDKQTSYLIGEDAWKNKMVNFKDNMYRSTFKGLDSESGGFLSNAVVAGLNNFSNKAVDYATIIMMYVTTATIFFMIVAIIVYLVVLPNGLGGEKFARGFEKVTGVSSERSNKNLTDLLSRLGIATIVITCLYANLIPIFISSVINIVQYFIALF